MQHSASSFALGIRNISIENHGSSKTNGRNKSCRLTIRQCVRSIISYLIAQPLRVAGTTKRDVIVKLGRLITIATGIGQHEGSTIGHLDIARAHGTPATQTESAIHNLRATRVCVNLVEHERAVAHLMQAGLQRFVAAFTIPEHAGVHGFVVPGSGEAGHRTGLRSNPVTLLHQQHLVAVNVRIGLIGRAVGIHASHRNRLQVMCINFHIILAPHGHIFNFAGLILRAAVGADKVCQHAVKRTFHANSHSTPLHVGRTMVVDMGAMPQIKLRIRAIPYD